MDVTRVVKASSIKDLLVFFMMYILLALLYFHVDALIGSALAFIINHADKADLGRVLHVRPAIGLQVKADDLDGANLLDSFG